MQFEVDLANELAKQEDNAADNYVVRTGRQILLIERGDQVPPLKSNFEGYNIYSWPGYRLMMSRDNSCLMVVINKREWVTVSVNEDRVSMQYFYDETPCVRYSVTPYVKDGCVPLVYLVLFLWDLTENHGYDFESWLLNVSETKPFTTHYVFAPYCHHGTQRQPTTLVQLRECYEMYADFLDGDPEHCFSTELVDVKPWKIRTNRYHLKYLKCLEEAQYFLDAYKQDIRNGVNVLKLDKRISQKHSAYLNEGYFLFEEVLFQDRPDLAVYIWLFYDLDDSTLLEMVKKFSKYNKVVEFVYSLNY